MKFDIDEKTLYSIKELDGDFFIKQIDCVWWKIHSIRLWSGVSQIETEELSDFNKYNYQGINIYVDKKIDDSDTIQIRVNSYRQRGKLTFRTLRLEFKETQRKPE